MEKQECKNCGATFEPTCHKTRQKFCSAACRFRYNNAKRDYRSGALGFSQEQALNCCKYCGCEVAQTNLGLPKSYCSEHCMQAWWDEQKELNKRPEKIPKPRKKRGPPKSSGKKNEPPEQPKKQSWHPMQEPLEETPSGSCPQCGKEIYQRAKSKPRKFCSEKCRYAWWRVHRFLGNSKAFNIHICQYCGREFEAYGNTKRKYCDRDCYDAARGCRRKGLLPRKGSLISARVLVPRRTYTEQDWRLRLQKISDAWEEKPDRRIILVCGTTKLLLLGYSPEKMHAKYMPQNAGNT